MPYLCASSEVEYNVDSSYEENVEVGKLTFYIDMENGTYKVITISRLENFDDRDYTSVYFDASESIVDSLDGLEISNRYPSPSTHNSDEVNWFVDYKDEGRYSEIEFSTGKVCISYDGDEDYYPCGGVNFTLKDFVPKTDNFKQTFGI